jgi:uncharacterized cupin superfamily protein
MTSPHKPRPLKKLNIDHIPHRELQSARTGEWFSLSAVLSEALGMRDVFVHHEVIPPGRRASGAHTHSHREELVVVLTGEVIAWVAGSEDRLGPGDAICFPPGDAHPHYLRNDAAAAASVLVIASNPPYDVTSFA